MKPNKVAIFVFFTTFFMSCVSQHEKTINNSELESEVTKEIIAKQADEEVNNNDFSKYEIDFENYKLALEENDTSLLYRYNESDETDIETLLMLFSDSFFMGALKKTKYDELTKVNRDEQVLLEFSVQQLDYDDDGNEIGAAVFLYFKESKNKLLLHSYLAAG